MCRTEQNNSQIHSEIKNTENLRFRKRQHRDSHKFGQSDSGEYLQNSARINICVCVYVCNIYFIQET